MALLIAASATRRHPMVGNKQQIVPKLSLKHLRATALMLTFLGSTAAAQEPKTADRRSQSKSARIRSAIDRIG